MVTLWLRALSVRRGLRASFHPTSKRKPCRNEPHVFGEISRGTRSHLGHGQAGIRALSFKQTSPKPRRGIRRRRGTNLGSFFFLVCMYNLHCKSPRFMHARPSHSSPPPTIPLTTSTPPFPLSVFSPQSWPAAKGTKRRCNPISNFQEHHTPKKKTHHPSLSLTTSSPPLPPFVFSSQSWPAEKAQKNMRFHFQ